MNTITLLFFSFYEFRVKISILKLQYMVRQYQYTKKYILFKYEKLHFTQFQYLIQLILAA